MYGTFVYIREDHLKQAMEANLRVFVKIPQGTAEIIPSYWMASGKRMSKVFLRPDEPMILWGNHVPVRRSVIMNPVPHVPIVPIEVSPQKSLFDKPKRGSNKPEPPTYFV